MGLLQPDSGLLFWMSLSFLAVFLLLAKFGFPVIIEAIEKRKAYIDSSLEAAEAAERRLAEVNTEAAAIVASAENERTEIVRRANETREQILAEARDKASSEGERLIAEARRQAGVEREAILKDARRQVALLAIAVTERMLREKLDDKEQSAVAERLLDEIEPKIKEQACTPD